MITERTTCRVCGGPFDPLLNLGSPVLSDFLKPEDPDPPQVPLDLVVCQRCELVQLRHTVDPEKLYRTYWYRSSINESMRAELADIASTVRTVLGASNHPRVILDIGANDGFLLSCFDGKDWNRVGVEPARNIQPIVSASQWLNDFFPRATKDYVDHCCDAICSIACFYDLDDPLAFVAEVDRLLTEDGVWIVQFQDLLQQVQSNAFDNCVAEHLCYYTTETFRRLLEGFDLWVVDLEERTINGGSLRFVIQRRSKPGSPRGVFAKYDVSRDALDQFAWRVGQYKAQLNGVLDELIRQGHYIDQYGASTKASTLLQYCGIDHTRIRCAVERSPEKWGLVSSGTRIPIISEEEWRRLPAPVSLATIWQFRDNILQRERVYLENGGSFIFPLPRMEVVTHGKSVERPQGSG